MRILCPKPVITRNEPGLQWLIGSPFFPDPLAVVSTFRCVHSTQPGQSTFSVDYAKESGDVLHSEYLCLSLSFFWLGGGVGVGGEAVVVLGVVTPKKME